jgi:TetR/AcrR family transcriptional regulator, cholesterol catabolism regulator
VETRDQILKGAGELFLRYGLKSITMDEIARHLSISKKTLYQHFRDKDELLISFLEMYIEIQKIEMRQLFEMSEDVIDEMMKTTEHMRTKVCNINPSLLFDLKKYHSNAWNVFQLFKNSFIIKQIEQTLTKGIAEGYFRQEIDVKVLSRLRMEEVEMGFNPSVFNPEEYSIAKVQMQLLEHFMYGICTLKGHKKINQYKQITEE